MTPPTGAPPSRTLALALAILRISLGLFLLIWAVEKFVMPEVTVRIWDAFYFGIDIGPTIPYVIGALETALAVAILIGFQRKWAYGLGTVFHGISTLSTWKQLLSPFGGPNHLFVAGVPVLAAFVVLYLLREWDLWTVDGRRQAIVHTP